VEQGICPIATLYSLAAAFSAFDALVSLQPFFSLNKNSWLPWEQGSSREKFTWQLCIDRARKYEGRCKQRAIIFYGDQIIPLWNLHWL